MRFLAAALMVAVLTVPGQNVAEGRQTHTAPQKNEAGKGHENHQPDVTGPSAIHSITNPASAATSQEGKEQPKNNPKFRIPSEWMMVILTAIYVAVSTGMLFSIRKQAAIAEETAKAAKDNAIAAKASADAMINAERAWVLVDTGEITDEFVPDLNRLGFFEVRPVVKNYGRTVARITRASIRSHQVPTPADLPPEPEYQREQATDIVLPPQVVVQPLTVKIPLSDFIEIRRGKPVLFIYGFVDYVDFGNKERQSRFCFVYHVPSGFDSTKRGFYLAMRVPPAYIRCT